MMVDWSKARVQPAELPAGYTMPTWLPLAVFGAVAFLVVAIIMRRRRRQ